MTMTFWLKERIDSARFAKVEHLGGRDWLYRLRIRSLDELDDEVGEWLCLSYRTLSSPTGAFGPYASERE